MSGGQKAEQIQCFIDTERNGTEMTSKLTIERIGLDDANAFVTAHHRHHKRVVGHLFSIAAVKDFGDNGARKIVGVVIVGRPVARMRDDGRTAEVTRLCTDGTKNACSFLYGAAARAAFALGFKRIGTYILASEPGTSLTGAGWRLMGQAGGGSWSRDERPRVDKHPTQAKLLFETTQ
jgi:hypothetical protein